MRSPLRAEMIPLISGPGCGRSPVTVWVLGASGTVGAFWAATGAAAAIASMIAVILVVLVIMFIGFIPCSSVAARLPVPLMACQTL
jgi:hypothetical protein